MVEIKNQNDDRNIVLDLCNLNGEQTKRLNIIAEQSRLKYTELVDQVSENNINVSEWWYTAFVSRENSQSSGFLDFCLLQLALEELGGFNYDLVYVPRKSLKKALKRNLNQNINIIVKEGKIEIVKRLFLKFYCLRNLMLTQRRIETVKKNTNLSKTRILDGKIILVDTYCIPSQFNKGEFKDRYFMGLKESIPDRKLIFLAQLDFSNLSDGALLADNVNSLDYMFPFEALVEKKDFKLLLRFIKKRYSINNTIIEGIDYKDIVENVVYYGGSNITSMYGILKGEVIKRILKREGTEVTHLIGWYEGQASSNGLFLSAREVDDEVYTIAYISVPCPENNIGLSPSRLQNREKKVAEFYAVGGRAWMKNVRQFDSQTKCCLAPAFRQGDLGKSIGLKNNEGAIVILSGVYDVAKLQLEISLNALIECGYKSIEVKNHPFYSDYGLKDYCIDYLEADDFEISFVKSSLVEAVRDKAIAIVSETSSSLEILLQHTKVIDYIPNGKLSYTCIPQEYMQYIDVVYSKSEMIEAIKSYSKDKLMNLEIIKDECFAKISEKMVYSMVEVKVNE